MSSWMTSPQEGLGMVRGDLDRMFEALIVSWEATGAADSSAAAAAMRDGVEQLCAAGVHVGVVGATRGADIDKRLLARPVGPGTLHVLANHGLEVAAVTREGLRRVTHGEQASRIAANDIRLGDRAQAARWMSTFLDERGIGPGLALIVGAGLGARGEAPGPDAAMLVAELDRSTAVALADQPEALWNLIDDQLRRRDDRRVPDIDEDPRWTLSLAAAPGSAQERVQESLLTLADGRIGTRGSLEEGGPGSAPMVLAAGVYTDGASGPTLLAGPTWTELARGVDGDCRRVLDLRTGVLHRRGPDGLRALRFSSIARPGTVAMRSEAPSGGLPPAPPLRPSDGSAQRRTEVFYGDAEAAVRSARGGGIAVAALQLETASAAVDTIERLAAYATSSARAPEPAEARIRLRDVQADGFATLLAEHRAAWARRWADSMIRIDGDPESELAARFALFHLMASAAEEGEAAVGARGLSGPAYAGHVFWDADVFVLPFLAATRPAAARAMLEYRIARLPAARRRAKAGGMAGAQFPWESADDGEDVTPRTARDRDGKLIPILTGEREVHIVADVAWGASTYGEWTGDEAFLAGPGLELISDTARYWASRARRDDGGRAHIDGVIGPDEYHELVDDNAYTNVMARWNLRRAAELGERYPGRVSPDEVAAWRELASALVDGYDAGTGLYEQFAGFYQLAPLKIAEIMEPPVAADLLLGREVVQRSQILKQADALMLHHLVPDEVAPGSLRPNLEFYAPRTAHGSSLSPAVYAALCARDGRPDLGMDLLRTALRLDLDDLTGTVEGGLHLATFGGIWQALAYGFLGLRPAGPALRVAPRLAAAWDLLEIRVRFRGARLRLRATHEALHVDCDRDVALEIGGRVRIARPPGSLFRRAAGEWEDVR